MRTSKLTEFTIYAHMSSRMARESLKNENMMNGGGGAVKAKYICAQVHNITSARVLVIHIVVTRLFMIHQQSIVEEFYTHMHVMRCTKRGV